MPSSWAASCCSNPGSGINGGMVQNPPRGTVPGSSPCGEKERSEWEERDVAAVRHMLMRDRSPTVRMLSVQLLALTLDRRLRDFAVFNRVLPAGGQQ